MKKLLVVSAAVAALVFSACSTTGEAVSNAAANAQSTIAQAAAISSLAGDNAVTKAVSKVNGVVSSTTAGTLITLPANGVVKNGALTANAKTALNAVAAAATATNTSVSVGKLGSASTATKKVTNYLSSKGVSLTDVANLATSDNKVQTGVQILLNSAAAK